MPSKSHRVITISGWVFAYWLATADELQRLVPEEPEKPWPGPGIRWRLVADAAEEAIRIGRRNLGEHRSPAEARAWGVTVSVPTPIPLSDEEASVVWSLLTGYPAGADFGGDQVSDGRHRMYYSWQARARHLPVESSAVSAWLSDLYGDNGLSLGDRISSCRRLIGFAGRQTRLKVRPGVDVEFVEALSGAAEVAEEFIRGVDDDA